MLTCHRTGGAATLRRPSHHVHLRAHDAAAPLRMPSAPEAISVLGQNDTEACLSARASQFACACVQLHLQALQRSLHATQTPRQHSQAERVIASAIAP